MKNNLVLGFLMFVMKYFFDVEREITQQMLWTMNVRLNNCKDFVSHKYQLVLAHK